MDSLYLLQQSCSSQIANGSYWGPWLLFGGTLVAALLAVFWEWRDYKRKGWDGDDDIPGQARLVLWFVVMAGSFIGFWIIGDILKSENVVYGIACDGFIRLWQWLRLLLVPVFLIGLAGNVVWMMRVTGLEPPEFRKYLKNQKKK